MMKLRVKIWLEEDGQPVFGDGRLKLLKEIQKTGSITAATENLGVSYRHAWGEIRKIEQRLGFKLIDTQTGGRGGGGASLTPRAIDFLQSYEKISKSVSAEITKKFGILNL
ncbi:MAG TPA: LysR family transcriptional regulator [bacterium]|nr:MAG: Molybdenum-pterin-binding protein MopA [bacterium ADurb.Bin236]HOY62577.1 LysR family transcriptional regulator [bacterium]HPI75390.1 LysR family transcriptional regulator [bacterium]